MVQRVEAESPQGSQDPGFQPIEIVKRTDREVHLPSSLEFRVSCFECRA
jgi:hypothetical protein